MYSKLLGFLLLTVMLCGGCATVVIPPSQFTDPATVYLVDYGRTSAIVLPNDSGGFTRYAYGDWDWYAMHKREFWRAVPALLWPTRGGLGRMQVSGADSPDALKAELSKVAQNLYAIPVERSKALALSRRLDGEFQQNIATMVHTPSVGLDFVHYGYSYWALRSSNHRMAGWLHDLGVRTRGYPAWAAWIIRDSATETAKPTRGSASPSHP